MTFRSSNKAAPDALPSWPVEPPGSKLDPRSWFDLSGILSCAHVAITWQIGIGLLLRTAGGEDETDQNEFHW